MKIRGYKIAHDFLTHTKNQMEYRSKEQCIRFLKDEFATSSNPNKAAALLRAIEELIGKK